MTAALGKAAFGAGRDSSLPSANPGDSIEIAGQGLAANTGLVASYTDLRGQARMVVLRPGSVWNGGNSASVTIPADATGILSLRCFGTDALIRVQVVPTMKATGGTFIAGSKAYLAVTGVAPNATRLFVDGQEIDRFEALSGAQGPGQAGLAQQWLVFTVPSGIDAGLATIITNGGTSTLRHAAPEFEQRPDLDLAFDPADQMAQAVVLDLPGNQQVDISGRLADARDVDLYRLNRTAGDQISLNFLSNPTARIWLFDEDGNQMFSAWREFNNEGLAFWSHLDGRAYYIAVSGGDNASYDPKLPGSGTDGHYAGGYVLRVQRLQGDADRVTRIVANPEVGAAAKSDLAAANVGQYITILGSDFRSWDRVLFTVLGANGAIHEEPVPAAEVSADGSSMRVLVPAGAVTGIVRLERDHTGTLLQIVPRVYGVQVESVSLQSGQVRATILIEGTGFAEGVGSSYSIGEASGDAVTVIDSDAGANSGPDVVDTSTRNGAVRLVVSLPPDLDGPLSVNTVGGTVRFAPYLSGVAARAASGTPATLSMPSANPGQIVTLTGTQLSTHSTAIVTFRSETNGTPTAVANLAPLAAAPDGSWIKVQLPEYANGLARLHLLGSSQGVDLQVVPVLRRLTGTSIGGSGLVPDGTRYDVAGTVVEDQPNDGLTASNSMFRLDQTRLPTQLVGDITATTIGGTAAPMRVDAGILPGNSLSITGIDHTGDGELWALGTDGYGQWKLERHSLTNGAVSTRLTIPWWWYDYGVTYSGLRIAPVAFQMAGQDVPEGSLLLFGTTSIAHWTEGYDAGWWEEVSWGGVDEFGNWFGGTEQVWHENWIPGEYWYEYIARVDAVDAETGWIIATLNTPAESQAMDGAYDPASGLLKVLGGSGQLLTLNPTTGAVLATTNLGIGFPVALDIDPADGSMWLLNGSTTSSLHRLDEAGQVISRRVLPEGTAFGYTAGISLAPDGQPILVTSDGLLIKPVDTIAPPRLDAITATAIVGSSADPNLPSANIGQTITLTGVGFDERAKVLFDVIDDSGVVNSVAVWAVMIGSGSLQVTVPDGAVTGDVRVRLSATPEDVVSNGLRLQIVPRVEAVEDALGGDWDAFLVVGSGFWPGRTTLISNEHVLGTPANEWGAFATVAAAAIEERSLDAPIRVVTDGGWFEQGGRHLPITPGSAAIAALDANAWWKGQPTDRSRPSAVVGQTIDLIGYGFTSTTPVVFEATDASGRRGTVTRTGSPSTDGKRLTVQVPTLAVTGAVRLLGTEAGLDLQVAPVLLSHGGSRTPGEVYWLEGVGLARGDGRLYVDGVEVADFTVNYAYDASSVLPDGGRGTFAAQQFLSFVVPAGIAQGLIEYRSPGGVARIGQKAFAQVNEREEIEDFADTFSNQMPLGPASDEKSIIRGSLGSSQDVDIFELAVRAGDSVSTYVDASLPVYLRFLDRMGNTVFDAYRDAGDTGALAWGPGVTGICYLAITTIDNNGFDPELPQSTQDASVGGEYTLHIEHIARGSSHVYAIDSPPATDATPMAMVAAARPGDTISLVGRDLLMSDTVLFTMRDGMGRLFEYGVSPNALSPDRRRLTVQVPEGAATGEVRIWREASGQLLRILT